MSITTCTVKVTRKYLRSKSKEDLIDLLFMYMDREAQGLLMAYRETQAFLQSPECLTMSDVNSWLDARIEVQEFKKAWEER